VYGNALLFVATFVFVRPFVTLVYVFVEREGAVKGRVGVGSGYVTVETASCAGGYAVVCKELRAARWLLIPEVVVGAVVLGMVLRLRLRLGRVREEKEVRV
jgi:hypothetical protein